MMSERDTLSVQLRNPVTVVLHLWNRDSQPSYDNFLQALCGRKDAIINST